MTEPLLAGVAPSATEIPAPAATCSIANCAELCISRTSTVCQSCNLHSLDAICPPPAAIIFDTKHTCKAAVKYFCASKERIISNR